MLTLNLIISCCLLIGIIWVARKARINKANEAALRFVTTELENIYSKLFLTKNLSEKNTASGAPGLLDLDSAAMLGTIITVLIRKFGGVQLSVDDFAEAEGDYVSVYVDQQTSEIILSLDHTLTDTLEDPFNLLKFSRSDDKTYH